MLKGRNLYKEVDFRTHLEASVPSVCDFAVLGNSKDGLVKLVTFYRKNVTVAVT